MPPAPSLCILRASLSGDVFSVSTAASQKKGAVSYYFDPLLRCPPLAALSDDRREEFKPRWQRNRGTKELETAPFFVCSGGYRENAAGQGGPQDTERGRRRHTLITDRTSTPSRFLIPTPYSVRSFPQKNNATVPGPV